MSEVGLLDNRMECPKGCGDYACTIVSIDTAICEGCLSVWKFEGGAYSFSMSKYKFMNE